MAARPPARSESSADAMSSPTRRWCSVECFSSSRSASSAAAACWSSGEREVSPAKMRASAVPCCAERSDVETSATRSTLGVRLTLIVARSVRGALPEMS